jgi:hypothetical protein
MVANVVVKVLAAVETMQLKKDELMPSLVHNGETRAKGNL